MFWNHHHLLSQQLLRIKETRPFQPAFDFLDQLWYINNSTWQHGRFWLLLIPCFTFSRDLFGFVKRECVQIIVNFAQGTWKPDLVPCSSLDFWEPSPPSSPPCPFLLLPQLPKGHEQSVCMKHVVYDHQHLWWSFIITAWKLWRMIIIIPPTPPPLSSSSTSALSLVWFLCCCKPQLRLFPFSGGSCFDAAPRLKALTWLSFSYCWVWRYEPVFKQTFSKILMCFLQSWAPKMA